MARGVNQAQVNRDAEAQGAKLQSAEVVLR
jgi:hypothetical protein